MRTISLPGAVVLGLENSLLDLFRVTQQSPPFGRQIVSTCMALKERITERLFQPLHPAAEGGGADACLAACLGQAPTPRDEEKKLKIVPREVRLSHQVLAIKQSLQRASTMKDSPKRRHR